MLIFAESNGSEVVFGRLLGNTQYYQRGRQVESAIHNNGGILMIHVCPFRKFISYSWLDVMTKMSKSRKSCSLIYDIYLSGSCLYTWGRQCIAVKNGHIYLAPCGGCGNSLPSTSHKELTLLWVECCTQCVLCAGWCVLYCVAAVYHVHHKKAAVVYRTVFIFVHTFFVKKANVHFFSNSLPRYNKCHQKSFCQEF